MKVLGVHVLSLLVTFIILSVPEASGNRVTPNWSYVKSCVINVSEDLGHGRKRERSYCCEGWRSMVNSSGQLHACSEYIGEDNVTNSSSVLSTLAEWKKVAEEVNGIHEHLLPMLSSGGTLGTVQDEIQKNQEAVLYLEGKVNQSEARVKELEAALEEVLAKSGYITDPVESPCSTATCTNHPDAVCLVVSKCRKDYPVFWNLNTFTPIEDCETAEEQCPPRSVECDQSLCDGLSCTTLNNASCIVEQECCFILWQTSEGDVVECPDGGLVGDGRKKRSAC